MSMEMIYLLMCVTVALGAMVSCFYFAKKDWPAYAAFAFLTAAAAFTSASDMVKITRNVSVAQVEAHSK